MSALDPRTRAAGLLRELGHHFVARELSELQLDEIAHRVAALLADLSSAPLRVRSLGHEPFESFASSIPVYGADPPRPLFADSIVSGSSNPFGLGAYLWRDGDQTVMEVILGAAFEGAPGRAHGGIVAALIDETMGMVLSIHGTMAFTAQLDISFRAATPVNVPLTARAWLERRDGRKMHMRAVVTADGTTLAEATSLFLAVDPLAFLTRT